MTYGCFNRPPLATTARVQTGWGQMTGVHIRSQADPYVRLVVDIPVPMTKNCQYALSDLGRADARCAGCKHHANTGSV